MIGAWFRRLPIRQKLVAIIMVTSVAVLTLASAGYLITDYFRSRAEIADELEAQARLILQNSQTALLFDDVRAARENLETLSANSHLRSACLYREADRLFAELHPRTEYECPGAAPADGSRFTGNRLELSISGESEGKRFGSITLRSDLQLLTDRLRMQGIIVTVLLLASLGLAMVMSSRLQAVVSAPVMQLAGTAAAVSSRGDYSLRADRTTDDELGTLVDAFNRMLEQIELRETELSRTNDELRREVAERRRAEQERAALLVREREANRLKDEFLATLSHELRTPLNAILGWTKLLRAKAVPPESLDRALEKVERNAQVQSRLVEDLLEISRITSGKLRLDQRPIDLVALTNTALETLRPVAEARGVAVERHFEDRVLPTVGDPDRLQQVIWNLLSNAVKFTPAGGTVTVALRRTPGSDEIVVSDTGIGIEPSFLPSVFDTFRQADASSTRAHGGLGLGLSIVKRLVEMHGGEVTAESRGKGRGATFTVRLPVRSAAAERADSTPPLVPTGRLAGARILVVDDDPDTRELLATVLGSAGADVHTAASADEALAAGVQWQPEAIVSDIAMPGRDGYQLMRQLDSTLGPATPRVRIALSAFARENDRARALDAGFQQHIPKPVDPVALVQLLGDMLQGDASPSS